MFESIPAGHRENWSQLAVEIGGEFADSRFSTPSVTVGHRSWTVVLDMEIEAKVPVTRLRASFTSTDGFQCTIFRRHLLSSVAALLGLQDIEIGVTEFDREFIIRANNPGQVKKFLANPKLRDTLEGVERPYLFSTPDTDLTIAQQPMTLVFRTPGLVTNVRELLGYFEFFREALDQMAAIGSARA